MDGAALVALLVMVVGLAGAVIPGLPGVLLVFAAAAGYALVDGFEAFGAGWLLVMGVIAVAATVFDVIAQPAVARRFGASKWGVIGAIAGLIAGFVAGGPVGAVLGPLAGAVVFELLFGQTMRQAFRSGLGTAAGFVAAIVVDVTAGLVIIGLFIVLVVT